MKKTARLITFFITLAFLLFSFAKLALADSLIRPIPDEPTPSYQLSVSSNQQLTTINQQLITSSPSITFGDLLNSNISSPSAKTATSSSNLNPSRLSMIKDLLSKLDSSYQESQNDFQMTNQQLEASNQPPPTDNTSTTLSVNPQPITHNPQPNSPTPYIPIPTLVAGVSEIVSNQQSTDNPSTALRVNKQQITDLPRRQAGNRLLTTNLGAFSESPIKTTYTIAFLGDSMVDTLGKDLPHLKELLKQAYPNYSFTFLNYGQGGTDLASGLYRLTQATNYLGTDYPPLLSYKPDILVVESFAYNHWSGHFYDLDRQWLTIAKIIDVVKENSPETKIILAAIIAPNALTFGDGILNWPAELKWESANITRAYLQNLVNFATSQKYPLSDAYHPSLGPDGNGLAQYINQGDHLHPSNEGALLFSQKVIETIKKHNLIP